MPLSPTDKAKAQQWLNVKFTQRKECSTCGTNSWVIGDHIVSPTIQQEGGGLVIGGTSYPQFMLICRNCGRTHYFNAVLAGLVVPPKENPNG